MELKDWQLKRCYECVRFDNNKKIHTHCAPSKRLMKMLQPYLDTITQQNKKIKEQNEQVYIRTEELKNRQEKKKYNRKFKYCLLIFILIILNYIGIYNYTKEVISYTSSELFIYTAQGIIVAIGIGALISESISNMWWK